MRHKRINYNDAIIETCHGMSLLFILDKSIDVAQIRISLSVDQPARRILYLSPNVVFDKYHKR